MTNDKPSHNTVIGIVSQITNDNTLNFISNSNFKCNIADIIAVRSADSFVLAEVTEIETDYYLDNAEKYFISKAVENSLQKLPSNPPRYGQIVTAATIGHYTRDSNNNFIELKHRINRYTPKIFQEVFSTEIESIFEIYGLVSLSNLSEDGKAIDLGYLSYPVPKIDSPTKLFFSIETFKKHTLITGVTGSGKSRLASLIAKQLAVYGGHVSLLDPHNEYSHLLRNGAYSIYKFHAADHNSDKEIDKTIFTGKISFFDKELNPQTLTKLIPFLSVQQETLVYETFDKLSNEKSTLNNLINFLLEELNIELKKENPQTLNKVNSIQDNAKNITSNPTNFITYFITELRKLPDLDKNSRLGVLMALITKINELRLKNLLSSIEPNWLKNSPNTIDIFNIDYSTNEYVRRYINSILQFFLRKKDNGELRVLIIDEAHMLLRENETTIKLVKQLLREGRKYGISVIFVSQNASDIPDDIKSQFQNHFMFRELNTETKYFSDQLCNIFLYGAKSKFAMKVKTMTTK